MPQTEEKFYTSEDYWSLPEGKRAELIDGHIYMMTPSAFIHQKLIGALVAEIHSYIHKNNGGCEVIPAPFAVNLTKNDKTWVEPDISVICDKSKLSDRGCEGAPDFIIEVVSPNSRKMDFITKSNLYPEAGVREYWIVDPAKGCTTIYRYEEDVAPINIPFDRTITVGIYNDLSINISELLK